MVGYNDQDAYIIYVPSLRKTVTTVAVRFDESISTHEEDHPIFVKDVVRMLSAPPEPALVDPLITPQGKIPKGKSRLIQKIVV